MATDHDGRGDPRGLIAELCREFYVLGWATGTGGGISIRDAGRIFLAPSGVQKERITPRDVFELSADGEVVSGPADRNLRPSECTPLFMHAYRMRDAGAVLHSHGMAAMLASLQGGSHFECVGLEMIKGLRGLGYRDRVRVPIIDNTPREADLADAMADAIRDNPGVDAVLVRRHGVYVWGKNWAEAKTQAECYHYLFEAAVRMRQLGLDPTVLEPRRQQ